jgi:hypothetical protein
MHGSFNTATNWRTKSTNAGIVAALVQPPAAIDQRRLGEESVSIA